jgi:hypothetical protein
MTNLLSFVEGIILVFLLSGFVTVGYFSYMASASDFRFPWEKDIEDKEEEE